jgi:hypothetical protein
VGLDAHAESIDRLSGLLDIGEQPLLFERTGSP